MTKKNLISFYTKPLPIPSTMNNTTVQEQKVPNMVKPTAPPLENGDKEGNKILKFFLAPPIIPLILGSVFLLVARIVNAAVADVNALDLWAEYLYGVALIAVGIWLMWRQGLKEPNESFLPFAKSSVLRKFMRFAPMLASVIVFYIASTVARASDSVKWSDVTMELIVSAVLFVVGIFFLIKA